MANGKQTAWRSTGLSPGLFYRESCPENGPAFNAREEDRMKMKQRENMSAGSLSERDAALVARVREITDRGNNVEIRRKGDGYSVLEVSKKSVIL